MHFGKSDGVVISTKQTSASRQALIHQRQKKKRGRRERKGKKMADKWKIEKDKLLRILFHELVSMSRSHFCFAVICFMLSFTRKKEISFKDAK